MGILLMIKIALASSLISLLHVFTIKKAIKISASPIV